MAMKRILLPFLLFICLAAGALAQEEHTHAFDQWDRDLACHWQACLCGEAAPGEKEAHALQDGWLCVTCGSEITLLEEGAGEIDNYNEDYDLLRMTLYENGAAVEDYRYVYQRDEQGRILGKTCYWNGLLQEECTYRINAWGESVPVLQLFYEQDGATSRNEYDVYGNIVKVVCLEPDGSLSFEETTEYSYDGEGNILHTKVYGHFAEGESYRRETNGQGDGVFSAHYDIDGQELFQFRTEFGYDAHGNKLWSKQYLNGVLSSESIYEVVQAESAFPFSYEKKCIAYLEEGGWEEWEYDMDGNEIRYARYDALGTEMKE